MAGPALSRSAALDADVTIRFDRPLVASSLTPRGFTAFGRWSGVRTGEYRLAEGGRAVTLSPRRPFQPGWETAGADSVSA